MKFDLHAPYTTVVYTVQKQEIAIKDTYNILEVIQRVGQLSLEIRVDGYNHDQRDLWEITKVKKYFMKLIKECPLTLIQVTPETLSILEKCCSKIVSIERSNGITYTGYIRSKEWQEACRFAAKTLKTLKGE
jgi:hypothetical protein